VFRPIEDPQAKHAAGDVAGAHEIQAAICTALAANPIDEHLLQRGVWTYVGAARQLGTSPGRVIMALNELVEAAHVGPMVISEAFLARVILWCVEAYFGHLGGDVYITSGSGLATAPVLALVR
jgi:hypothetical protein